MPDKRFDVDGRQWLWSAHSLDIAETCHRRYYYEVVLNLSTRSENAHALFGILIHEAVEEYEHMINAGLSHGAALLGVVTEALKKTWDRETDEPKLQYDQLKLLPGSAHLKTRENLIRTIIWYLEDRKDDPCVTETLADGRAAVELEFSFELDKEVMLRGRMDKIVRYAGEPFVHDVKTTGASISGYYFKRFELDMEMSLYSLAARTVFKSPVNGVLIDAAQIAVGFSRFARAATYRTAEQLAEWIVDTKYHIHMAWEAKNKGYPMRLSACQKYGGCPFLEVCRRDPRVREAALATGYVERDHA